MGLFRRRETLHEELLRRAGLDPAQLLGRVPVEPHAPAPWPPPLEPGPPGSGSGVGRAEWDACVTVRAPGLPGERLEFTALPDGDLLVGDESPPSDLSPLADAVERDLEPPYRALAARQEGDLWAVGARRIEVAAIEFPEAETLELSRKDSWDELRVDGEPSEAIVPELVRLGERVGPDFFVKAERVDGDLWEIRVTAL
ncbi:MAG TPA: hypothetical protein VE995_04940 [Gaiellaceae bacterium]|nr:hypothetical protein [Gaiellaceae bacterium]